MRDRFSHKKDHGKAPSLELLYRKCLAVPHEKNGELLIPLEEQQTFLRLMWREDSFVFSFSLNGESFCEPSWPEYRQQDAIEIYLATRLPDELKKGSRYCHVFLVFPDPIEGISSREITEFRHGEERPRVEDNVLSVTRKRTKKEVTVSVEIPFRVLFGWEEDSKNFAFACSLWRKDKDPLWFPHPAVEKMPFLLAEVELQ
jgi:hypothetical protein